MGRVMVVDDDQDVREVVSTVLMLSGHECVTYSTATEALRDEDYASFDVIVLDEMMPDMTGTEFFNVLRGKGLRVPVIFLSADREIERKAEGLEAAVAIKKPFDIAVLEDAVIAQLEGRAKSSPPVMAEA